MDKNRIRTDKMSVSRKGRITSLVALGMLVLLCLCSCDLDQFFQPYWPPVETDVGNTTTAEDGGLTEQVSSPDAESVTGAPIGNVPEELPEDVTDSITDETVESDSEMETAPDSESIDTEITDPEPAESEEDDPVVELPKVEFD